MTDSDRKRIVRLLVAQNETVQRLVAEDECLRERIALLEKRRVDLTAGFEIRIHEMNELETWLKTYRKRIRHSFQYQSHPLRKSLQDFVRYAEMFPTSSFVLMTVFCESGIYQLWLDVIDNREVKLITLAKSRR